MEERAKYQRLGEDVVEFDIKLTSSLEGDNLLRRQFECGRIGHLLTKVGPGMLLPGLVQNIADRPKEEVAQLFERLGQMKNSPTYDDVQAVLSWYELNFLPEPVDIENDPFRAWQLCVSFACKICLLPSCLRVATGTESFCGSENRVIVAVMSCFSWGFVLSVDIVVELTSASNVVGNI